MESRDVLEGIWRGRVVYKEDTMGSSQVAEKSSVSNERNRSHLHLPITLPKNVAWPLDDIQDKDAIIWQSHGFLVGT